MIEIIPAILPDTFDDIIREASTVHQLAPNVQIDFCDGKYVPNKTWWYNGKDVAMRDRLLKEDEGLPMWDSINYDFDLMITDPLKHIDTYLSLGPARIIIHAGSVNIQELEAWFIKLPEVTKQMVQFGIALRVADNPRVVAPIIPHVNIIQVMGVKNIGYQGQDFDTRVYGYIEEIKKLYPGVLVAVDGGIKMENVVELVRRGVSRLVIGSLIFKSTDPRGTMDKINSICEQIVPTA